MVNIFDKPCTFEIGVAWIEQLPTNGLAEIAFAGRSNVGKSSLINAVTRQSGLARASTTPGRTQQLNFFNMDGTAYLVDLPGYGFAQAPEQIVKTWTKLIMSYLKGRVQLRRIFLLIDGRHGIGAKDEAVMKDLDKAAVVYQIVLTKCDKPKKSELEKVIADVREKAKKHTACFPDVLVTSSEKNIGIDEVRAAVISVLSN